MREREKRKKGLELIKTDTTIEMLEEHPLGSKGYGDRFKLITVDGVFIPINIWDNSFKEAVEKRTLRCLINLDEQVNEIVDTWRKVKEKTDYKIVIVDNLKES